MVPGTFYGADPTFDSVAQAAQRGPLAAAFALLRGGVDQAKNIGMQAVYRSRIGDVTDAVGIATGKDLISNQEISGIDRYLFGGLALAALALPGLPGLRQLPAEADNLLRSMGGRVGDPGRTLTPGELAPMRQSLRDFEGRLPVQQISMGIARGMYQQIYDTGAENLSYPDGGEFAVGGEAFETRTPMEGPEAIFGPAERSIGDRIGGLISRGASRVTGLAVPENVGNTAWSLSPRFQQVMGLFANPSWDAAARGFSVLGPADTGVTRMTRQTMLRAIGDSVMNLPHHSMMGTDAMKGLSPDMAGAAPELGSYAAALFTMNRIDRLLEIPRSIDYNRAKDTVIGAGPDVARTGVFGVGTKDFTDAYHRFTRGELDITSDEGRAFVKDVTDIEATLGFGIPIHAQLDPSWKIHSFDRATDGTWLLSVDHNIRNYHKGGFLKSNVNVNEYLTENGRTNETLVPHLAQGPMEWLDRAMAEYDMAEQLGAIPDTLKPKLGSEFQNYSRYISEVKGGINWYPALNDLMESISETLANMGVDVRPVEIAALTAAMSQGAKWETSNLPAVLTMLADLRLAETAVKNPGGTQLPHGFTNMAPFVAAVRARVPDFPEDIKGTRAVFTKLLEMGQLNVMFDAWKEAFPPDVTMQSALANAPKAREGRPPPGPMKVIPQYQSNIIQGTKALDATQPIIPEDDMMKWLGPAGESGLEAGQVYSESGLVEDYQSPEAALIAQRLGVIGDTERMTEDAYMEMRAKLFEKSDPKRSALIVPINGGTWGFNPSLIELRNKGGRWTYKYDFTGDKLRSFLMNVGFGRVAELDKVVTIDRWASLLGYGFHGIGTEAAGKSTEYQMQSAAEVIKAKLAGMQPRRLQSLEWVMTRMMQPLGPDEAWHNAVHPHLQHRADTPLTAIMGVHVTDDTSVYADVPLPLQTGTWKDHRHPVQHSRVIRFIPGSGMQVFAPNTRRMQRLMPNMVPTIIKGGEKADPRLPDWVMWVRREPKPVRSAALELNQIMKGATTEGMRVATSGGSLYRRHRYLRHTAGRRRIRVATAVNRDVGPGNSTGLASLEEVYDRANVLQWLLTENGVAATVRVDQIGHFGKSNAVIQVRDNWVMDQPEFADLSSREKAALRTSLGYVGLGTHAKVSEGVTQMARQLYARAVGEGEAATYETWIPTMRADVLGDVVRIALKSEQKHDVWIEPETPADMDDALALLHRPITEVVQKRVGMHVSTEELLGSGLSTLEPLRLPQDPERRLVAQDQEWTEKNKEAWNLLDVFFNEEALDYAVYSPEPDGPALQGAKIPGALVEADEHAFFDGSDHAIHMTLREGIDPNTEGFDAHAFPHAQPVMIGSDLAGFMRGVENYRLAQSPEGVELEDGRFEWANSFEVSRENQGIITESFKEADIPQQVRLFLNGTSGPLDVVVERRDLIAPDLYSGTDPDRNYEKRVVGTTAETRSGYWTEMWPDGHLRLYQGNNRNLRKMGQIGVKGDTLTVAWGQTVTDDMKPALFDRLMRNWLAQHPGQQFTAEEVDPAMHQYLPDRVVNWGHEAEPSHFAIWLGNGKGNQINQIAYDTDQIEDLVRNHLGQEPEKLVVGRIEWSASGHPRRIGLISGSNPAVFHRGFTALLEAGVDPDRLYVQYPQEGITADGQVVPYETLVTAGKKR
jgi:hypothetical protein